MASYKFLPQLWFLIQISFKISTALHSPRIMFIDEVYFTTAEAALFRFDWCQEDRSS